MSDRTAWYETDIKGQLFLETVLVEGNEPVLFTCLDVSEKRYLVEMLDSFEGKYLIVSVDTNDLLDMLRDNITLEQTFRKQKEAYLTSFNDDFDLVLSAMNNLDIPSEYLPMTGEYFELSTLKIQSYIEHLSDTFSTNCHITVSCYDNLMATFKDSFNMTDVLKILSNDDYESSEHQEDFNKKITPLGTQSCFYSVNMLPEEVFCEAA